MTRVAQRRRRRSKPFAPKIIVDMFAGGGGASLGIRKGLGRGVDVAINHDIDAIEMHSINHPEAEHLTESVWKVYPSDTTRGRRVGLLWCSPDCTHHSNALGGKPRNKNIRGLAWSAVMWAGLEHPDVIILENVREFENWGPLTEDGKPDKSKAGITFKQFVGRLRGLGYVVEWRELNAADFGAATNRRRLFMVARCDGKAIVWPKPTHAAPNKDGSYPEGLMPHKPAWSIIDWSKPCPSIFMDRAAARAYKKATGVQVQRPLAENTMYRIFRGFDQYVCKNPRPFIIRTGHFSNITGEGATMRGQEIDKPLGTICSVNDKALVVPSLLEVNHGGNDPRIASVENPLHTITGAHGTALQQSTMVEASWLAKHFGGVVGGPMDNPTGTITATDHHSLCAAHLLKLRGSGGWKSAEDPIDVVCAGAPTFGVVTSWLEKMYGTAGGADIRLPIPTITSQGQHIAQAQAFLIKYYGTGTAQGIDEPLDTITAKSRFGIVQIQGIDYQLIDIGMRMLTPRELARAQGFPDDYILTGGITKSIERIGNSVAPDVAAALAAANVPNLALQAA